ncbi:MAG TPA: NapC/NirT family cytochrome c [Opitutaceae bacterium]
MPAPDAPTPVPTRPPSIWKNWISLAGAILGGAALFAFILLFAIDQFGPGAGNPYVGVLSYLVAPGFGALGVALILVGAWLRRRQLARNPNARLHPLAIDLSRSADRRRLGWFALGAMTFLFFTSLGSYQTYQFTESVEFCGQVCHRIMSPEATAHRDGAHARVACVDCHIGHGATWYVKAKVNGAHQVWASLRDNYSRPVPTPIANLRPARETCEECHWPEKFVGNIDRTYRRFLADDETSPFTVRLLLHVGGAAEKHGPVGGIHWHINPDNKVEYYASDPQRLTIPWIRVTDREGKVTVYKTDEFTEEPPERDIRTMDCLDCHNRPAHNFRSPNDAVDQALAYERIDRSLPAVKRTVVELLTKPYATAAEATAALEKSLRETYAAQTGPGLDRTIATVTEIYQANFFPEMKADWSAYPVHAGHKDSPGCFRCHSSEHKAVGNPERTVPASDCQSCHTITAQGSGDDLAQFSLTGFPFKHPDGDPPEGLLCNDCHNGKLQSP